MYFHHNNNLAWISIAKNACTSWQHVFDNLGWIKEDLFNPQVDLAQLKFFGFLREPQKRHTMGIVEYLCKTNQRQLLNDEKVNRLFVSAVFDQHSYSVCQMIPDSILDRTTFFALDQTYYNYETLLKNFLDEHGVQLTQDIPRLWAAEQDKREMRTQLDSLKLQHLEDNAYLVKNFLDRDMILYRQTLWLQSRWNRVGDLIL
jgi:hypothetical protein